MNAQEVIERIMSHHWDMTACKCWICQAGRNLSYGARSEYLPHNDELKLPRVKRPLKELEEMNSTG